MTSKIEDNSNAMKEKIRKEVNKTIENSPIVVCVCGHNKWETLFVVKHVPKSISKSEYIDIPILSCRNCGLDIPKPSTLKAIPFQKDKLKGEILNESKSATNESKDGSSSSSKDDRKC